MRPVEENTTKFLPIRPHKHHEPVLKRHLVDDDALAITCLTIDHSPSSSVIMAHRCHARPSTLNIFAYPSDPALASCSPEQLKSESVWIAVTELFHWLMSLGLLF